MSLKRDIKQIFETEQNLEHRVSKIVLLMENLKNNDPELIEFMKCVGDEIKKNPDSFLSLRQKLFLEMTTGK